MEPEGSSTTLSPCSITHLYVLLRRGQRASLTAAVSSTSGFLAVTKTQDFGGESKRQRQGVAIAELRLHGKGQGCREGWR